MFVVKFKMMGETVYLGWNKEHEEYNLTQQRDEVLVFDSEQEAEATFIAAVSQGYIPDTGVVEEAD